MKDSDKRKPVVMVVDDSPAALTVISKILSRYFEVEKASSGREAIDKATELKPDVMLLDATMQCVDGWEVCRRLKKDPSTSNVKIIMHTGYSERKKEEKAFSVGADHYVNKSVKPEELIEKIQSIIDEKEKD